ncbi:MAG: AAA-like domain-containing protein [Bacteroidales bacterium]|nr:AAA-like domain-containing protein [Bacteroidales bacterium]
MAKKFNTSVICDPKRHYMVDVTAKMKVFEGLIDDKCYFTITRARQFGKTSALNWILRNMSDRYLVIPSSFELYSQENWVDDDSFGRYFCTKLILACNDIKDATSVSFWENAKSLQNFNFDILSQKITEYCHLVEKKVVLMIDEVDKASNNEVFLRFLSMLRNLYLKREQNGDFAYTFWSVILAGVYDVKNLKLKIRPEEEHQYNSPWNVAADYYLDMTFNPQEISTMLVDYENDYHLGFDIKEISEEIYKYTSGYPVLVSRVCKEIDERLGKVWTKESVLKAVKNILKDKDFTLLDDISKNLQLYNGLHQLMYDIIINGRKFTMSLIDPMVRVALMFSYVKENEDGNVDIHNLVFEEAFNAYFVNEFIRKNSSDREDYDSSFDYIQDGELNMVMVIDRFKEIMADRYKDSDQKFLENHGRLLFLCFIKPIINGTGFCYFEPQTKSGGRMDLIVNYNRKEYIVELKIWRGSKYETDGKVQLAKYLTQRGLSEGYLITFSFLKNKVVQEEPEWVEYQGKRIYEAVI